MNQPHQFVDPYGLKVKFVRGGGHAYSSTYLTSFLADICPTVTLNDCGDELKMDSIPFVLSPERMEICSNLLAMIQSDNTAYIFAYRNQLLRFPRTKIRGKDYTPGYLDPNGQPSTGVDVEIHINPYEFVDLPNENFAFPNSPNPGGTIRVSPQEIFAHEMGHASLYLQGKHPRLHINDLNILDFENEAFKWEGYIRKFLGKDYIRIKH